MKQETQLAILFADVCGSTKLYDTLGDVKARSTVARCIQLMTEATESEGGTLIKTIGDEVMTTFKSADDAAAAATDMQEAISGGLVVDGRPIAIRVGFHMGPVLLEEGDVFGDAVNLAARMAGQAKAGQILTTAATVQLMTPLWKASTRQIDRAAVKGKRDQIDVYEVIWQGEEMTRMVTPAWASAAAEHTAKLKLKLGENRVEVSEDLTQVTLGRAEQNDLVVVGDLISRLHARIEYRNGRFILTDLSTNGTYVVDKGGTQTFVRRDSHDLKGSGMIGLGKVPQAASSEAVSFTITE